MDDTDYYAVLGVSPTASDKDLAKAYRAKALQHHPDKNRDNPSAVAQFHLAKLAYDTLTDVQQRSAYDSKRRAHLAKRRRQDALGSQRKRMKDQLEKSESAARQARAREMAAQESLRMDAERFRREAMRNERMRDRVMRDHVAHTPELHDEEAEEAEELERSVRVRWDSTVTSHSQESLAHALAEFPGIEEIVVPPVSANTRRTRPTQSALIVFRTVADAHLLAVTPVPGLEIFWAAAKQPPVATPRHAPGLADNALPELDRIDVATVQGYCLPFAEFEAVTLMRMRAMQSTSGSIRQ